MQITLAVIGRAKAGPARELYEDYARRLAHGPFGAPRLIELEERRPLPAEQLRRREAELLLAVLPPGALVIALDERGRSVSSSEFAALLGRWRDEGLADLAFVIGGAEGLDPTVRRAAAQILSFGPMTWPHLLVRALLAEQLYRAQCILGGHPYHRE